MLLRTLFAAALAVGVLASSAANAQVKILVNIFLGPAHFIHPPYKAWGAEVGKVTGGRVTVEFLPASAAPPPKQIDGALAGNYGLFSSSSSMVRIRSIWVSLSYMLKSSAWVRMGSPV